MNLEQLRREYLRGGLSRADLDADPLRQFEIWMDQAIELQLSDPTAMVLATVNSEGQATQRIVLLKEFDRNGLVFYTNYNSRKAKDIAVNDRVSLLFPWHTIDRQVKICGRARKLSAAQSFKYFSSRPRDSQLAAWASDQSSPISSRALLLNQFQAMKDKFAAGKIPLPDFWGGMIVVPTLFEFWQGGGNRLHDRFLYSLQDDKSWTLQRLAP